MDLLKELSKDKRDVVLKTRGPCLVKAGAGTGKTLTIVTKVAYLIKKEGFEESRILGLTFSNSAAGLLKEEIDKTLGYCSRVETGTFHSFCKSILDKYGERIGIQPGFQLITDIDTAIILHKLGYSSSKSKLFANTIMKAKDLNISIRDYRNFLKNLKEKIKALYDNESLWEEHYKQVIVDLRTMHTRELSTAEKRALKKELLSFKDRYEMFRKYGEFVAAWEKYEKAKNERNALDLSDLNLKVLELLKVSDENFLSRNYDYVIVDEFQDTNYIQFELIKRLVNDDHNITVVGDPNQTIYAFRGAYVGNFEMFVKEFDLHEKDQFTLETSFRSTQRILDTSYELISSNYKKGKPIRLLSHNEEKGDKVKIFECLNELEEARKVKEIIEKRIGEGIPLSDIAVLYRSHSQGAAVKRMLENRGIPIRVVGGTDLLSLPEIKAVISLLELVDNLENPNYMGDQSWWRILHYENQLSPEDSIALANYRKKSYKSIQEVIFNDADKAGLSREGLSILRSVKRKVKELREFKGALTTIVMKAYEALGLNKLGRERKNRLILMRDFYEMARNFQEVHGSSLSDFISYLEIYNEMGKEHMMEEAKTNAVNLMTIHASKGLQFDTVILVNLASQRFPLTRGGIEPLIPDELNPQVKDLFEKGLSEKELEAEIKSRKEELKLMEERKLCYVAMTRAKKHLFLTRARSYGETEREPSVFLSDIGLKGYGDYDNMTYLADEETRGDWNPDSSLDRVRNSLITQLVRSLDDSDISTSINHLLTYKGLAGQKASKDYIVKHWKEINPDERIRRLKEKISSGIINTLPFDAANFKLSASALKNYNECPRKFELAYIYRMPTYLEEDTSGALNKGSFVHKVLEDAVSRKVKSLKEIFDIKDSLLKLPKWKGVDTSGVDVMLRVFWKRNKDKIKDNLYTEEKFDMMFKDFRFTGVIDRIDRIDRRGEGVEIIDYKTGKSSVSPDDAFIQLGLYDIAVRHSPKFRGLRPVKLTLEMLEHERPKEYVIENGIIIPASKRGKSISLEEVEKMILDIARKIMHDYQYGYDRNTKKCDRCPYRFYCT